MNLLKFRIKDFRAIVDTEWIECQQVTAFVGTNESGKTTILMALMKLMNSNMEVETGSTLRSSIGKLARVILKYDLPIDRAEELLPDVDNRVFIETVFSVDSNLNEELKKLCKNEFKPISTIYISKTYGSIYDMDVLKQFEPSDHEAVKKLVLSHLPAFIYYKELTEIASDINFVYLAYKIAGHTSKQLTLREVIHSNLLSFLDIWQKNLIKSIEQIYGDFESEETKKAVDFAKIFAEIPMFKERFDRGFASLNKEFIKWWGRNEVTIDYEVYKRGVRIVIIDNADGKRYLLQNRSTGFRRFFSLFLSFAVSAKKEFENAIMLFDEAGAALHPLTQRKLANYFMELGKYCQVMYNTHTSYMLPTTEMDRIRVVYKDETGHTKLSKILYISPDRINEESLFAAQASLAMHLAETSLIGCMPIAVVNKQDMCYLQIIKSVLNAKGRLATVYEALIFAGGENGIASNAEIFSANKELPSVLLASDENSRAIKQRLINGVYSKAPYRIFEISDFIKDAVYFEDLMPPKFIKLFLSDYLRETLGDGFIYDEAKQLTVQIEEYAKNNGIELSEKYRVQMAKAMKLKIMDNYKNHMIPGKFSKPWSLIMKRLLKG